MSTEHQQYSRDNQSAAIQKYADSQGFHILQTYSDAAKSGIGLKRRRGLRQLLQDVVAGTASYRVILVYDVSRWGAFKTLTSPLTTNFCANPRVYLCITARKSSRMMARLPA